jgi:hypothetical protein
LGKVVVGFGCCVGGVVWVDLDGVDVVREWVLGLGVGVIVDVVRVREWVWV